MTRRKLVKLLRSGAVVSLLVSVSSAISALAGLFAPEKALVVTTLGTLVATFSQSLPQLFLELLDDPDVDMGQGGQTTTGTEVSS